MKGLIFSCVFLLIATTLISGKSVFNAYNGDKNDENPTIPPTPGPETTTDKVETTTGNAGSTDSPPPSTTPGSGAILNLPNFVALLLTTICVSLLY